MTTSAVELVDLHNHTDRSYDAVNRLEHYERAHAAGRFDVLAITDHNRVDGAFDARERASFPVIVGMEIDTADGELIGLFLQEAVPPGRPASGDGRADPRPGRPRVPATSVLPARAEAPTTLDP